MVEKKAVLSQEIVIPLGNVQVGGFLTIPPQASAIILFAHGSGSSRHSPRNQYVAKFLQEEGFATLLFDLLTEQEEASQDLRFEIDLLAQRLMQATTWVQHHQESASLSIGYFGASTGAAAALVAAAQKEAHIFAIVSRGGRPDLAAASLSHVRAPTLLIVGGNDTAVIALNQKALDLLTAPKKLEIIPGATHLFEERGALEEVARLSSRFFHNNLIQR